MYQLAVFFLFVKGAYKQCRDHLICHIFSIPSLKCVFIQILVLLVCIDIFADIFL